MGRLPDGAVVHGQVVVDPAHDDFTRVEPDPDLDVDVLLAEDLLGVLRDQRLHLQRGVPGPHGVVLVRDRRAEQRHDPVPHDLVHRALVTVDRRHHPLQDGIQDPPGLLGVAIGQEL